MSMKQDPIGRLLKVTTLGSQKEKLNHVPNATINPLQITGKTMRVILESNPPGTIPVPSKVRSITLDVVGKPTKISKEDFVNLARSKPSLERHLSKPFGYSEKIFSKSKSKRSLSNKKLSQRTYQHPDTWNKSINCESKRKQFNQTKEQTLKTLRSMSKVQRDEFIFKSHVNININKFEKRNDRLYLQNQVKIIEAFYNQMRKTLKTKEYQKQYGDDLIQYEDYEQLSKLFNQYTKLRNINIGQRTDQLFVYMDELKDFCFTIGFNSKDDKIDSLIESFYEQIYNPSILQDVKIISAKPTLQSLRSFSNIGEKNIPGQALLKKTDMISMRAVFYNYKKFIHENFDIHEKLSRTAAKQLLVDLVSNIQPWVLNKKHLESILRKSQDLEQEFLTEENLLGNKDLLKKINKKIKERNEQIQEKLIIAKFLHPIVRRSFLYIDKLKDYFINFIVNKSEKISYLEDFMAGFSQHLIISQLNEDQSLQHEEQQTIDLLANTKLHLVTIAEFIHSNKYRGDEHDNIIQFLVKIKKLFNDPSNNEYIMSYDVTAFCSQYKARQDLKQNVLKNFIQKAKLFYDKHVGDAEVNDENLRKFDSNTIGTYALKKMQKYDNIIWNRAEKINEILNLVQKRTIFGVESHHYDGPISDTEFFESIEQILNIDKKNLKIHRLFSEKFVHAYIEDYIKIQEQEKLNIKSWNDEINQALFLYKKESSRLLNVLNNWKPQQDSQNQLRNQKQNNENFDQSGKQGKIYQQQIKTASWQEQNQFFFQDFVENSENRYGEFDQSENSQRDSRSKVNSGQFTQQQQRINNHVENQKSNKTPQNQNSIKDQNRQNNKKSPTQNKGGHRNSQTGNEQQRRVQNIQQQNQIKSETSSNKKNKTQKTEENQNESFFEYIDNQYQDKNNNQIDKRNENQQFKTANIFSPNSNDKQYLSSHSSHNELSTFNKSNQDTLSQDPQIQQTNQMYDNLWNILHSIKDEFHIV